MASGGLCATMAGQTLTHKWCVDSLATGNVKYSSIFTCILIYYYLHDCACVSAYVTCRLGETLPPGGLDTPVPRFGVGSGPILLDDVSCTGKEPSLLLCNRREWLRHDCTHHEDVNIACRPEHNGEGLPTSKTVN